MTWLAGFVQVLVINPMKASPGNILGTLTVLTGAIKLEVYSLFRIVNYTGWEYNTPLKKAKRDHFQQSYRITYSTVALSNTTAHHAKIYEMDISQGSQNSWNGISCTSFWECFQALPDSSEMEEWQKTCDVMFGVWSFSPFVEELGSMRVIWGAV